MPNWTKEQSDAINKDGTNIIVSAGAGSGKTAVLSERVLRKLKEGVNVNELLILTFTKAAAKEMKERIRKKIKKEPSLSAQLELIDSAYITTFDSYSLSVLKKYHYLLNLPKNIGITDSTLVQIKKEEILDNIFEELYEEKNEKFEEFISTFCTKDDKEIRNYLLNIYSKLELKTDKKEYLEKYINEYFNEEKIRNDIDLFKKIILKKKEKIEENVKELSFLMDGKNYTKLLDSLSPLLNSENYRDVKINLSVSMPRMQKLSDEEKELKEEINDGIKELKNICIYESTDEIYKSILSTKKYVECIIDILTLLNDRITKYKLENNMYEFNDVAALSIKILKEFPFAREEIKNSLNEIMIDEYQDTNNVQEEFISLISNNNVYMVGDIKQSIYRFRNANPYIFKNKYDNYKNNNGGIKIDLNKNFRSREEVLNNINDVFKIIMDDEIGGANYKESHEMVFGNLTYNNEGKLNQNNDFEIYNYEYDSKGLFKKEEIEAFIIANDIKEKINNNYKIFDKDELIIRNAEYNDFVILMDKSSNFDLYKRIFEYLNVPLTIEKDESIIEEVILKVLKNLLILISKIYEKNLDVEFKYMFISVARSFLFEMSDEEIFDIFNNNSFKDNDLYIKAKSISEKLDYVNINSLIVEIIDTFKIYENISKIGNVNSNITILDYLLNSSTSFIDNNMDIYDFINYLKDLTTKGYDIKINRNSGESNSVKIMTIHKSKGLEYHICYYSGLYSKFNISDLNDKFIFDNKYGIISPYFDEGISNTIYKYLLKEDYIKEEISEKIRLFYVALTRAKEKMILVTDLNQGKKSKDRIKYRSFKDIMLSVIDNFNDYITNIDIEKLDITKDYKKIKQTNYLDYITKTDEKLDIKEILIENEELDEKSFSKKMTKLITKEENDSIKFGLDMHYALEVTDFTNPNFDNMDNFIKNKIIKFLDNDLLKNIKNAQIYKEYEFVYEEENEKYHGIIDLMLIYPDHIDIVDYKLKNIIDENYTKQLNGYKKYIENKTKRHVNTYLYSILGEKIEKISC